MTTDVEQLPSSLEVISKYRGHAIYRDEDGFFYEMHGFIRRCNSAWSCKVSIDEELSP
jgi:hypothetical protein